MEWRDIMSVLISFAPILINTLWVLVIKQSEVYFDSQLWKLRSRIRKPCHLYLHGGTLWQNTMIKRLCKGATGIHTWCGAGVIKFPKRACSPLPKDLLKYSVPRYRLASKNHAAHSRSFCRKALMLLRGRA